MWQGGISPSPQFSGPYAIVSKLSDVIKTPDQRRKSCVCHINMLKPYISHSEFREVSSSCVVPVASVNVPLCEYSPEIDGFSQGSVTLCVWVWF